MHQLTIPESSVNNKLLLSCLKVNNMLKQMGLPTNELMLCDYNRLIDRLGQRKCIIYFRQPDTNKQKLHEHLVMKKVL